MSETAKKAGARLSATGLALAIALAPWAAPAQEAPAEPVLKETSTEAPKPAPAEDCSARKFIGHRDLVTFMAADLQRLPDYRTKGTRYITLSHLHNACAQAKGLEVYRQGVGKLINSLSRSPTVLRLETIDPDRTIIRFNIDDLGWEEADWNAILAAYPYGVQPDTKFFGVVQQATNTQLPYIRGDWFAFAAAQPPLYHQLLKLPDTFKELQKQQGVDVEADLQKFLVQRAGMQESGMSPNNRMIERHQSRTGYFWTSYNFASNKGRQNIFDFPLGPGGDNGFTHDLSATLFSLPNGFQGFYLADAGGAKVDKAPTQVLRDFTRRDLSLTTGLSCFGCHAGGIIRKVKDEVRPSVFSNREIARRTRDAIEAMHPEPERLDRVLEDDAGRFRDAMGRAGLDPDLKLNGTEMISALALKYDANVDLPLAAAEFGLRPEEFRQVAGASGRGFVMMRRLEQGRVPRDQFEDAFPAFVTALTDDTPLARQQSR